MTLPETCTPREKQLNRLIYEALLRRIQPERGPWWYPLEEALGITPGSINPMPEKKAQSKFSEADWQEFYQSIKNGHYPTLPKPVNYPT